MTKEEKIQLVEELREKFQNNSFFYILDSGGMSVAEINNFRGLVHAKGLEYRVVKNTLIKKALYSLESDYTELDQALKGFSGVLFSSENGSAPAKLLKEFRKNTGVEKPFLKGASIDASIYLGEDMLEELTKIKSKEDVLADLVGLLQSPGMQLANALKSPGQIIAGALQSGGNLLAGALKALADKKEKEG